MKHKILSILIFLTSICSSCQTLKKLNSKSIEDDLISFLITKGEIKEHQIQDFKEKKSKIYIVGILNGYSNNELIDGLYFFSAPITHTRTYYLIVENDKYKILDLSHRNGLDTALKNSLDFFERQKYCSEITQTYITRILNVYYSVNKNPIYRSDINCTTGVNDTKRLP